MTAGRVVAAGLVAALLAALPGALRGEDADPLEAWFYKAYYLEKEARRPEEALLLYLQFIRSAPDSPFVKQAARFAHRILVDTGSGLLEDFLQNHGHLIPPWEGGGGARPAEPAPRTADGVLLDRLGEAAASGRPTAEERRAEIQVNEAPRLFQDGRFLQALKALTSAYRVLALKRVATMLHRKDQETEDLRRRVAINDEFGGREGETNKIQEEIRNNERALAAARADPGFYVQIGRLYPDAPRRIGQFGFLGLTLGLADPTDPRFASWMVVARGWLREMSLRRNASNDAIAEAVRIGQQIQDIEGLVAGGAYEEARTAVLVLWTALTQD
jgi:tetratricopeptide (TPR) repeat protein